MLSEPTYAGTAAGDANLKKPHHIITLRFRQYSPTSDLTVIFILQAIFFYSQKTACKNKK